MLHLFLFLLHYSMLLYHHHVDHVKYNLGIRCSNL
nr:MAG TPA: hypothetical protein [Caudoviricetes sp.]